MNRFVRLAATPLLALSLAFAGVLAGPTPMVAAFTGHGCTKATCSYFTSKSANAKYYYRRSTCDQWRGLSNSNLQGFKTSSALLSYYPGRTLHKPC